LITCVEQKVQDAEKQGCAKAKSKNNHCELDGFVFRRPRDFSELYPAVFEIVDQCVIFDIHIRFDILRLKLSAFLKKPSQAKMNITLIKGKGKRKCEIRELVIKGIRECSVLAHHGKDLELRQYSCNDR